MPKRKYELTASEWVDKDGTRYKRGDTVVSEIELDKVWINAFKRKYREDEEGKETGRSKEYEYDPNPGRGGVPPVDPSMKAVDRKKKLKAAKAEEEVPEDDEDVLEPEETEEEKEASETTTTEVEEELSLDELGEEDTAETNPDKPKKKTSHKKKTK